MSEPPRASRSVHHDNEPTPAGARTYATWPDEALAHGDGPSVSHVTFAAAAQHEVSRGLLGWTSFRLHEAVVVDGVAVRRTLDGRATLSFPARRDRQGRDHPIVRPLDDAARRCLESQILGALGIHEEVGS